MKVVVLGSNSFSGQDFIDLLLDHGEYSVIGISRSPEKSPMFLRFYGRHELSRYQFHQLDLNSQMDEVLRLLDTEQPNYIVNFAAQSEVALSWNHPEHWYETNNVSLAKLVNHLRKQKYLEKYLHISSPEVYGSCVGTVKEDAPLNPSTPYAASKAAADTLLHLYHKEFGFPLLMVRATNVYGARQQLHKIIPRSVIYFRSGKQVSLHGGGKAVKSYIHIRDVSQGELAVLERGKIGQIYHLSPDEGITVRDVVRTISERLSINFEKAVYQVEERVGQDSAYVIDSGKAKTELSWTPSIAFHEGIVDVIDWSKRHWEMIVQYPMEYQHQP
ncbi:MAG: dTDP-glucose 4,6-dehydratase [Nitrospirales bacterium]|nr:MAG: dTDP-glucose 4,6-dehydratase [Nitrospirales bacterium]